MPQDVGCRGDCERGAVGQDTRLQGARSVETGDAFEEACFERLSDRRGEGPSLPRDPEESVGEAEKTEKRFLPYRARRLRVERAAAVGVESARDARLALKRHAEVAQAEKGDRLEKLGDRNFDETPGQDAVRLLR